MVAETQTIATPRTAKKKYGSMHNQRAWALRWSYFFLILFAVRDPIFVQHPLTQCLVGNRTYYRAFGGRIQTVEVEQPFFVRHGPFTSMDIA